MKSKYLEKKELEEKITIPNRLDLRSLKTTKLKHKNLQKLVHKCIIEEKYDEKVENPSFYHKLFPSLNERSLEKVKKSLEDVITNSCKLISNNMQPVLSTDETKNSFYSSLVAFYPFQSYNEFKNLYRIIFKDTKHMKMKYEKYIKYYNQIILPDEFNKDLNVMDKAAMKEEASEGGANPNRKSKDELKCIINEIREENFGDF